VLPVAGFNQRCAAPSSAPTRSSFYPTIETAITAGATLDRHPLMPISSAPT
jgi:hypothetical protein